MTVVNVHEAKTHLSRLLDAAVAGEEVIIAKDGPGKLPEIGVIIDKLPLRRERFEVLPVSFEHALLAGQLPGPHRDPFDRMLIAQARKGDLRVVTADPVFSEYGVKVIWPPPSFFSRAPSRTGGAMGTDLLFRPGK